MKKTRTNAGREVSPSYVVIDSQSIKTAAVSEECGIDGGKKKGGKRHIVVYVLGCLLSVIVHAANIHNTKLIQKAGYLPQDKLMSDICLSKILRKCWISGYICL